MALRTHTLLLVPGTIPACRKGSILAHMLATHRIDCSAQGSERMYTGALRGQKLVCLFTKCYKPRALPAVIVHQAPSTTLERVCLCLHLLTVITAMLSACRGKARQGVSRATAGFRVRRQWGCLAGSTCVISKA